MSEIKAHGHDCACGCNGSNEHTHAHEHAHGENCSCGCHDHDHNHDDCFEHTHHKPQSFEAVLEVASEAEGSVVVHGWICMPEQSKWIVHAWAEVEGAVYDLTESRDPQALDAWYASHGVTEERLVRYGRVDFFTRFAETGSMGPFDEELFFTTESDVDPLLPR